MKSNYTSHRHFSFCLSYHQKTNNRPPPTIQSICGRRFSTTTHVFFLEDKPNISLCSFNQIFSGLPLALDIVDNFLLLFTHIFQSVWLKRLSFLRLPNIWLLIVDGHLPLLLMSRCKHSVLIWEAHWALHVNSWVFNYKTMYHSMIISCLTYVVDVGL